jgi:hypothetical protein
MLDSDPNTISARFRECRGWVGIQSRTTRIVDVLDGKMLRRLRWFAWWSRLGHCELSCLSTHSSDSSSNNGGSSSGKSLA